MAHYAYLDESGVVTFVCVGRDENDGGVDWEAYYASQAGLPVGRVKRTSYNTVGNTHKQNGKPFRKNYAGVGYAYDSSKDAFVPPKPYASWVLDNQSCTWKPPTPMPNDGKDRIWDEATKSWVLI